MKTMKAEETIKELRLTFNNTYDDVTRQLKQLCIDRENNQKELNRLVRLSQTQINDKFNFEWTSIFCFRLQKENDNLLGKYSKHSLQLQNEVINLPDTVDVSSYPFCIDALIRMIEIYVTEWTFLLIVSR